MKEVNQMNIALLFFGIASISNVSGAEKVFVNMANEFVKRGAHVYSIWNDEPGVVPYYPFLPEVRQVNLGLGKIKVPVSYKILRETVKALRLNIKNRVDEYKTDKLCKALLKKVDLSTIDVLVCYEFNSIMVANQLSRGKLPVVAMCHNSVENQIESLTLLQRKEVSRVDIYQVLMPSYVPKAQALLRTDVCFIPNVVEQMPDSMQADLTSKKDTYKVVSIGRIDRNQKQTLIAIKAFLSFAAKFPNWLFEFYGPATDQHYKQEIDNYIKKNDFHHQVKYMGITSDASQVLSQADILAFPSAYEGFSLVLTEANAVGVPAIGFSYAPSVNELIQHGKTGILVETEQEFAEKLSFLMKNQDLRCKMGSAAKESMKDYAPDIVWGKWEALLTRLTCKNFSDRRFE